MYKVRLVNMPFAAAYRPSLGLMQLHAMLQRVPGVSCDISYVNQDFVRYVGVELYTDIAEGENYNYGLGDWLFRQLAFPDAEDNAERYFRRYFNRQDEQGKQIRAHLRELRDGLEEVLDAAIERYNLVDADLVGFTSTFSQNVACFSMARRLKALNPRIRTAMGGANCESPMGQEIAKNVEHIDYVFSGPGLHSFPQFIEYIMKGQEQKCHEIDGVFSAQNYGRIVLPGSDVRPLGKTVGPIGRDVGFEVDLGLSYDDFIDVFEQNFEGEGMQPSLTFETSRGCWWGARSHCTFCGLNGMTMSYRNMEPEAAIEQFQGLFRYADRIVGLECVDNIMPADYPQKVFTRLETPANIAIFYETKANLTAEDIEVLSRARVKVIQPGVESLATSTLKLMRKGSTAFQNIALLKNCVMNDVFPGWNILIGFPGEEEDVYAKYVRDIPLLRHLPPPINVFPIRFDRFSPYFNERDKYGLDLKPCDFYGLIYPFDDQTLERFSYFFRDHNFEAEYQAGAARWLMKIQRRVDDWVMRWRGDDGHPAARLFLQRDGDRSTVYDSRSTQATTYEISSLASAILERLEKPMAESVLQSAFKDAGEEQRRSALEELRGKGLLFEERNKLMSLVCPREAPPMSVMKVGETPFDDMATA